MIPGIFDVRDDIGTTFNEKNTIRTWEWRRSMWKNCLDIGMGNIFDLDIYMQLESHKDWFRDAEEGLLQKDRRSGRSYTLFKIAAFGFEKQYKVLTVHPGLRSADEFRHINIKAATRFDSIQSSEMTDELLNKYDVILVDDKSHTHHFNFKNVAKNKTLFFIG